MAGGYHGIFEVLPEFLKRRIHPLEYAIRDFVRAAAAERPSLVVDAGAGESRFRPLFKDSWYVGIDRAVGDAAWNYGGLDAVADLEAIPLRPGVADAVLNTQVLEHVPDPAATIREMARILKPGGRLFLTAPQGWHEHQQPHDFFRFTRFALEAMLRDGGFSSWEIDALGGFFHYLGHRLTYIPKVAFLDRRGLLRVLFYPLELLSMGLFCFVLPVACYYLDRLDSKREFTLGYSVRAVK
ncbi:MAG: class I SAM-dependent methyltransferase [Acidobacteriota bacterium]